MSRNGTDGTFSLVTPGNPVTSGTVINPTHHNNTLDDIAQALTDSLAANGEKVPTANLPMGGFKHTGAGAASSSGQYVVYAQSSWSLGAGTFTGQQTFDTLPTVSGTGVMLQGVHTVPILAASMLSRTTNGAANGLTELVTNDVMLASKDFDQTTSEGVQFYIPMPKSWNEGTVTAQFGWTAASGAGTVTWSIAGTAFSDDDALDTAFSGAQSTTDTLITANDLHISSATSAITIAGTPAESDFVLFQITRDISDTLTADAKLLWCKIFVTYTSANDA